MGTRQTRTKGRRFVNVQCKVLTGWRSLKFRDAGGTGSRHPSSLGARPCVPGHVGPAAYPQHEAEAQAPQKRGTRRSMNIGHAPARRDTGTPLTTQPNPTEENKV